MSILSISGIKKHFGGFWVLDGIDMEINPGRMYQLIGSNGSGKTTLINVISGLIKPDEGRIVFDGQDITQKGPYETFKTGLVRTWQIPQAFKNLTTMENFLVSSEQNSGESFLTAAIKPRWVPDEKKITEKAKEVMQMVNLWEKRDILSQNLSGGQQKLLELGRALMSDAKMILMDEPIAGVNPTLAHEIFKKIRDICRTQKITFLIVEHRLDISLQYVEHVLMTANGKILVEGDPQQVIKHPKVVESYLGE